MSEKLKWFIMGAISAYSISGFLIILKSVC